MLEVMNLECIRGNRTLFSNLCFSVLPGQCLQVMGPNGSGKTSLLRLLCGLIRPSAGDIHWNQADIHAWGEEYNASFIYLGHRPAVKDELTSIENLQVSCGMNGIELTSDQAIGILEAAGLREFQSHPARLLSDGLRRRVALGRLLASRAKLWLLDETLTSLDSEAIAWITGVMDGHLAVGGMIVVATHQPVSLCLPVQCLHLAA